MVDLFKVDRNSWNTALILNNKQVFELYRLMLKGFYSCSDKKECVRYSFTYGDMFRHIADFLVEDFSKTLISKSIILEEIIDLELFRKYNKKFRKSKNFRSSNFHCCFNSSYIQNKKKTRGTKFRAGGSIPWGSFLRKQIILQRRSI